MAVAAADADTCARTSSSVSDDTKNSPASQSMAQKPNSSSQQQSNLPPRLQKKQRQAEEENYMKYYKPMDYMQHTNSYHRKVAADSGSQQGSDYAHHNGTGSARRVRDVHSRGSIASRTLWTDNLTPVSNGRSDDGSVQSNMKSSVIQSNVGDATLSDGSAGEQKPPVVVLTSSCNKVSSLEAGVASMNVQSTASNHMVSQPSYACPANGGKRLQVGDVCMAKYWQDNEYYKARIEYIAPSGKKRVTVFFTDYGNREAVSFADIRELPEQTWGVTSAYSPQTVYSIIPATATHGSNVVYQQSAGPSETAVQADASTYYYPPPYVQMASGGVHHITPASNCPVPGILVQGPPPAMQIFSATGHPLHDTFQSSDGAACNKTDGMRPGRSVQVYIPQAHRQ